MPPRASTQPRGLLLSLGVVVLIGGALAGGWWLGQRSRHSDGDRSHAAVERQADALRNRLADGSASEADQQRLVQLLLVLGEQQEATILLEQLADQQPRRWRLRLLLAELRRDRGDRNGASRELRQLLSQRPDQIEALQLLTLLQLEQGRGAEARQRLQASFDRLSKPPARPGALGVGLLLAELLDKQGAPGQAEAVLVKLAAAAPADQRPLLARALLLQQRGNLRQAQELLAQARRLRPGQVDPRLDQVASACGLSALRAPSPPRTATSSDRGTP